MPKNVLVVGMARSGTSLSASIFVNKGYFVADDSTNQLQAANKNNRNGYWELEELKDASGRVFSAVGFQPHNTWTEEPIAPDQAEAIFSLEYFEEDKALLERYKDKQPWMLKDPRFCYTLAYWWRLMDAETTAVLFVTRDPNEIWRSFQRIQWGDARARNKADFIRRIEDHIQFARETIRRLDIPHLEVDYSDYAAKPAEIARKLSACFDLELTPEDIGYESKYNHSGFRGNISYLSGRFAELLPAPARRLIKAATPDFLMRAIFPAKFK
jgi:hypothetical protein